MPGAGEQEAQARVRSVLERFDLYDKVIEFGDIATVLHDKKSLPQQRLEAVSKFSAKARAQTPEGEKPDLWQELAAHLLPEYYLKIDQPDKAHKALGKIDVPSEMSKNAQRRLDALSEKPATAVSE